MAKVFHVTSTGSEVKLGGNGRGEINYTASNAAGRPLRAHAVLVPLGNTDKSWLSIDGEAERPLPVDATEQFTVRVAVPAGTEPGAYRFRLDVVSEENPDEDFAEGPVAVIQAKPRDKKKPFPWWILLVVVGVLALGGLVWWLLSREPDVVEPSIVRFEAQPTRIQAGERARLSWEVEGAETRSIEPGVGEVDASGRTEVTPGADTTYTLSAGNEAGSVTREVSVEVTPVDPAPRRGPLARGVYTIQQKSNGRFVDAHENAAEDFRLVTRPAQNNATQRWVIKPIGDDTYTIQQQSNGRFVDAHENAAEDFRLVTRPAQNNETQRWIMKPLGEGVYTIQQESNSRFVDAHENASEDFRLVTRSAQNNDTQRWLIKPIG